MPDTIVLEFENELAILEGATAKQSHDGEMFDKLIDDVIECLYQKDEALKNLDEYARALETLRYRRDLSRAVMDFGRQLYRRADQFGLYRHGVFAWQYSGRSRPRQLILSPAYLG